MKLIIAFIKSKPKFYLRDVEKYMHNKVKIVPTIVVR